MSIIQLPKPNAAATKQLGVLGYWNQERGYGFIRQNRDGKVFSIFVHASYIMSGAPKAGAACLFDEGRNEKGAMAVNVEIIGGAL
jgi:cold shock CspA family protein